MENVAFYREWLPLNKKEFRILAMIADFGGEYHGNLTDMCRYFSVSPQHKNREALREAIRRLTDRHYTLTTSISRIRSKIESDGGAPYIKTVYGMGYQWTGGDVK